MKKIIIIFVLIFSLSFFCGCNQKEFVRPSDSVISAISFNAKGEITQSIAISVNSKQIKKWAKLGEEAQFTANLIDNIENLRTNYLLNFAVVYLQTPVEKYKLGSGVKITPVMYSQNEDVVKFEIIYSSINAWNYYNKVDGTEANKSKMPFLMRKQSTTNQFPFNIEDSSGRNVAKTYKQVYLNASQGLSFEDVILQSYSPTFIYCYGTHYTKVRSNADYSISTADMNYHVWLAKENTLKEQKVTLYYYIFNKGNCLLFALVVPILGLIAYFACKQIKQKRGER